ncbi:MAG: hypothetical protein Q4C49_11295 [Bacillota bacterium]|nr:hypothetical protein [Bacillota bacterium]
MRIKELFPKIEWKQMKQPMIRMFLLCAIYNFFYVLIQVYLYSRHGLFQSCANALSILSSLGLYYFCVKTWNKKWEIDTTQIVYVLGLQILYVGLLDFVLYPIYTLISKVYIGYLCMQVVCAFLLFMMIPLQLMMYKALSEGKRTIKELKEYIIPIVKENYKEILNQYLVILLIVLLIDVLLGGQISASGVSASMIDTEQGRINALSVCMNTLYVANPWMMFAIGILALCFYSVQLVQASVVLVIYALIGIGLSILEISYIRYIGELRIKKKKNGTKKAKTNR